jgi:NADPH:quinone reductase-like Zn-dependent oxidoreductase
MKAAQLIEYGDKDALKVISDIQKPIVKPGQVLLEVYAASVNPFDWKVRDGSYKDYFPVNFPATLGGDISGVITELGEGVSDFEVGQKVYGQANAISGQGSFAEYAPVSDDKIAAKPSSIDFNQAASLPLVSVSAYQAIHEHIKLSSSQKILVIGGGGGIGSMAVQLAKNVGAYVAATASSADADYVRELGADIFINYENEDFNKKLSGYDAVFDTVGGDNTTKAYEVLRPGGILVSMVSQPDEELTKKHNVTFISEQTNVTKEVLQEIAKLIDEGSLKFRLDKVFELDEAAEALEYQKTAHPKGKVVIQIKV